MAAGKAFTTARACRATSADPSASMMVLRVTLVGWCRTTGKLGCKAVTEVKGPTDTFGATDAAHPSPAGQYLYSVLAMTDRTVHTTTSAWVSERGVAAGGAKL